MGKIKDHRDEERESVLVVCAKRNLHFIIVFSWHLSGTLQCFICTHDRCTTNVFIRLNSSPWYLEVSFLVTEGRTRERGRELCLDCVPTSFSREVVGRISRVLSPLLFPVRYPTLPT